MKHLIIYSIIALIALLSLQSINESHETELDALAKRIHKLQQTVLLRDQQLAKYKADAEYIESLGATPDQAIKILKASEALNVSPK